MRDADEYKTGFENSSRLITERLIIYQAWLVKFRREVKTR